MEQRFGYGLDELARRFDRSASWVSRRLALVELLPEAIQQQVREGKIAAQVAMKYLVPVARVNAEDCAAHGGRFRRSIVAIRGKPGNCIRPGAKARASVRERILAEPELFLKTQRQRAGSQAGGGRTTGARSGDGARHPAPRRPAAGRSAAGDGLARNSDKRKRQIESARRELARMAERIGKEQEPNMLSQAQRTAILELHAKGVSKREIAQRAAVVAADACAKCCGRTPPTCRRSNGRRKPNRTAQQILELLSTCKGNLVRVHEELVASGAALSYPALTAFCRRQGIGQTPIVPAGHYHFEPGVEMQHDTSPHEVEVGGRKYKAQTASAVLCYSRMLFFQFYPTFQRFDCKVFLTDALRYFGGAPERVMIDNTHVVVLRGTGREMIPVPEMEAFAERFGFRFVAHEIGDANRSARVERPFHFIENNFLAGRTFSSWEDLNQQARQWCDRVNSTYKKHIRAVPRELFAVERLHLKPLPAWIPEVYRLHQRMVDVEGYVSVHTNRYSVPVAWIGRRVEVRETKDKIEIELDARHIVTHRARRRRRSQQRITLAEHRPPRGEGIKRSDPHPEEQAILEAAPEIAAYVAALKQKGRKVVGACPAATAAPAARISARAVSGRRRGSRPLWTLRSGPAGTHDSAPRGARLLSAAMEPDTDSHD